MEVLEKYEKIANEMFVKHNLSDWKFVWNNRTSNKTFGICKYRPKEVHLSELPTHGRADGLGFGGRRLT